MEETNGDLGNDKSLVLTEMIRSRVVPEILTEYKTVNLLYDDCIEQTHHETWHVLLKTFGYESIWKDVSGSEKLIQ